jgi:hypothetical protein
LTLANYKRIIILACQNAGQSAGAIGFGGFSFKEVHYV